LSSRLGRPDEYAQLSQDIVEHDYLNGETIRMDGALRPGAAVVHGPTTAPAVPEGRGGERSCSGPGVPDTGQLLLPVAERARQASQTAPSADSRSLRSVQHPKNVHPSRSKPRRS
jgi:hypothetical protein